MADNSEILLDASVDDLFNLLESFEDNNGNKDKLCGQDDDEDVAQPRKKLKPSAQGKAIEDGQNKLSHITVERNRRKQMNSHLSVLRSLMPCFYVKRGDQASIIGGVIDYIKELQQVLQSLEAKKQRKVYTEVLSPSPRPTTIAPSQLSPSPRIGIMPIIAPRTPQPGTPHKPNLYLSSPKLPPLSPSLNVTDFAPAANSKTAVAEVEVKFSGPNVLVKTISQPVKGQALKIIAALEGLALEILEVNIIKVDGTLVNSFTIKIGIECELSAEELAQQIQQTFS